MSSTKSLTLATTRQGSHEPCPCGCSPCPEDGCKLECLTRPRFFCGQLLTDRDLEALTGWTRDRLALARFRHGWGVACGLDVRCDPDPKRPAGVIVSPGYAVSCCGQDVVLCEEARLDLREACREDEEPCVQVRWTSLGVEVDRERKVDLFLRYREEPSEPQAAFGRSACKEVSSCEASRVRESWELVWKPAGGDPREAEARRWQEEYGRCAEVLDAFQRRFGSSRNREEIRRWLLGWIDEHPLHHFCFIRGQVCELEGKTVSEALLLRILFLLVQDCRNAFLQRACHACQGSEDVPLARICLALEEGRECRVCSIDPYPPYRRPLSPAGFPAALGDVNLGPWIWHREEEVCAALADLGVPVHKRQDFTIPASLAELRRQLDGPIFAECGKPVCLQVLDLEPLREEWDEPCLPGGGRVVGFLCEPDPEPEVEVTISKQGPVEVPRDLAGGARYNYVLKAFVRNTTSSPLELTITDDLPSPLAYQSDTLGAPLPTVTGRKVQWVRTLASGALFQSEWNLYVSALVGSLAEPVKVNNSFTVTGRKPGGPVIVSRTSNTVVTTIFFDTQTVNLDVKPAASAPARRPAPAGKRARGKK
jgi:hypothetical protein